MLLVLVKLVSEVTPNAHIAVPVSVTREVERIANANGATIVWTKRADAQLMEVASEGSVAFAGSPGKYIRLTSRVRTPRASTEIRMCGA